MASGLTLVVIGAILAFAVTDRWDAVNVPVVGLILMIAGGILMLNARGTWEKVVTRREQSEDPQAPDHVVQEIVRERRDDRNSG